MTNSPCIDICIIDQESGFCVGCGRTIEEINDWSMKNEVEKKDILIKTKIRKIKEKHQTS